MRISTEPDIELVKRAKAGDRDAFGVLVHRYGALVRRLTRAVLRHREDADDAAQEAFFSAWAARDRFDERQAFPPWLARIALNQARDLRRRRTVRRTEPLETAPAIAVGAPDDHAGEALLGARLDAALTGLSERQRVALVLFEVEGYAAAEIGELLGIPEGTVRSDVFHARRKLRAILGEREGS